MTFDQWLDHITAQAFQIMYLETHYGKEAVCEPGCTHSLSEQFCSRRLSRTHARHTGTRPS